MARTSVFLLVAVFLCLLAVPVFSNSCSLTGEYFCSYSQNCTRDAQICCQLAGQVYCGISTAGEDFGCAPTMSECDCIKINQVFCPKTGKCVTSMSVCEESDPCNSQGLVTCDGTDNLCGPSQEICTTCISQGLNPCPSGACATTLESCNTAANWTCESYGWVTCPASNSFHACAPFTDACFIQDLACENYGWIKCSDRCVPESRFCFESTCELQGLHTCPETGVCVQFSSQCNSSCNSVVCPDGRCVLTENECSFMPCPNTAPFRCENGECINPDVSQCCQPGTIRCGIDPTGASICHLPDDCIDPCNYTTHVRCPNGECVKRENASLCDSTCNQSGYKQCASGICIPQEQECPPCEQNQIWCPLQNECVDDASTNLWHCKQCPLGSVRCSDLGQCVENDINCGNNNVPICPPGQALCSNTLRCVDDLKFCITDTCPFVCPVSSTNPNGPICVNDPAECCSNTQPFYCAATYSCLASASECPGIQICNGATPFKCWDDKCVSNMSECSCPDNMFKCASPSRCVMRAEECTIKDDNICTGAVRCNDGTCKNSFAECGSTLACPSPLVQCADGATCARDSMSCPSVPTCGSSRPYFCASSGTCSIGPEYCPSSVSCGPNSFFCFFSKKCVSSASECPDSTGVTCPTAVPFLCRDGSCRKSSQDCPTDPVCPKERPVLCSSPRVCVVDVSQCSAFSDKPDCEAQNLTTCNDGQTCARSLSMCPNTPQCPPDQVLCDSGACAINPKQCPPRKNCTEFGLVPCNDGSCAKDSVRNCPTRPTCPTTAPVFCQTSSRCVVSVTQCPPPRKCPQDRPYKCPNRQCVRQPEECSKDVVCPSGLVRCPNSASCKHALTDCEWNGADNTNDGGVRCPVTGELKPSYEMCPDPPVCSNKERPVLCWDLSCRKNAEECPKPPKEDEINSTQRCVPPFVRCTDGHCRAASDCPQLETTCPNAAPIKCEDGTCRRALTDCDPPAKTCSPDQILCWDRRTCVDRLKPYECPEMTTCPNSKWVLCWDRTCRPTYEECPVVPPKPCNSTRLERLCWNQQCAVECPPFPKCNRTHPVLCPDHSCRANKSECDSGPVSPCPRDMKYCPRDGRCYSFEDYAKCENSKPDCPAGFVRCKDGSCVREQEKCSDTNTGCPSETPVRCATTHECIDPNKHKCPSASFCPANMPHRCPRGLCVRTAANCLDIDPSDANACIKLGLGKIVCSNGRCVNDSRECESVWPCDPSWVRCPDGTCRPFSNNCSSTNTCPSTLPHRCQDGTCAISIERCRNPSGCFGAQIRCPNGLCVLNSSECINPNDQNAPLANGCSRQKPHRCTFTGECVQLESYCLNSDQCPTWSPFRCPATRTCMKDAVECSSSFPKDCTNFTCPLTGECVVDLRLCKNQFGCPLATPVRCTSGECMPSANDCPRLVRCTDDKPFLCADMSCVASQSQCRPVEKCPDDKPVRCNDGRTCVPFLANCTSNNTPKCPESRPVLCSDGKSCVENPSSCANDPNDRCRLENAKLPFFCEATGFCVQSPYDCISTLPPCDVIDGKALVRCPSGICALPERCQPLPPCTKEAPFRCRDGSCAVDKAKCQDSNVPTGPCDNSAHLRCADGVCREKCTPVDGCKPGQIMCANHKCYNVSSDSTTFEDICRGSCETGMVELLDGTCANASDPIPERKSKSFVYTLPSDGSTSEIHFSDEDGGSINIGLFDLPNNTDTTVSVRPVEDLAEFVDAVRKAIQNGLILQHCSELSGVEISLLNSEGLPFEDVTLDGEVEIRLLINSRCNDNNNGNGTDICLAYTAVNKVTGEVEVHIEDCMGQKGYVKTTHFTPFFAVSAPTGNNPSESEHSPGNSETSETSENHNVSAASQIRVGGMLLLSLIVLMLI